MSKESDLKVIFYEPASEGKEGVILADGYFSFVPILSAGDLINVTRSRKNQLNTAVSNPLGHKTHRVLATDWVITVNDATKGAVATLIVSVAKIGVPPAPIEYPDIVATHV